ncbi:MAG: PLP-dependent aminotransferase family protein [Oscillospiraceae bacterium]|jgi:GntR family transcriptional regulator/MocR family aminotransferase|nr:PLP-dependent aminotransferase family protein [Oscillospiraceae bacterium]
MIYDSINLDTQSKTPLYIQLYSSIRSNIESGVIGEGEKLPSIRKMSEGLSVSRSTVETAYAQLSAEGYIEPRPQSGYYAGAGISGGHAAASEYTSGTAAERSDARYSFASDYIDSSASDVARWRKHVRAVLIEEEQTSSYGYPQGEFELRRQLVRYCSTVRGVVSDSDRIIIGAGIQPLLCILCGILGEEATSVGIEADGFLKAERVFSDFRLNIEKFTPDKHGIVPSQLKERGVPLLYLNALSSRNGGAMPVARRGQLLKWAEDSGAYIIEDDYNGELRYCTRPIPSLQSIDTGGRVIYLGSFSKLLMPSVRISYMVLPAALSRVYRERMGSYNQTSSKIEQLALSGYMQSGELERQLRRLRKLYAEKSRLLTDELAKVLPQGSRIILHETALRVICETPSDMTQEEILAAARRNSVSFKLLESEEGRVRISLSFAGIPREDIAPAVRRVAMSIGVV